MLVYQRVTIIVINWGSWLHDNKLLWMEEIWRNEEILHQVGNYWDSYETLQQKEIIMGCSFTNWCRIYSIHSITDWY